MVAVSASVCLVIPWSASAQEASQPSFFQDALLDDLVGAWTMTGDVMGDSVTYQVDGEWVLEHQFLRLRMRDVGVPSEYAAHVYIGYDAAAVAYTAHWLDTTGGQNAKALGTGRRQGSTITFQFEYPSGPFRTVFDRVSDRTWRVRMHSREEGGSWRPFGAYRLTPRIE